jgi:hypothetical protein
MSPKPPRGRTSADYVETAVQYSRELIARSYELLRQTERWVRPANGGDTPKDPPKPPSAGA